MPRATRPRPGSRSSSEAVRGIGLATARALAARGTAGTGRLILTSSLAGLVAVPGYTAYSAAKSGVLGFADALRREIHGDGLRVSVLCPPNTRTPGFAAENVDKPAEVLASEEKVRTLSAEDVAEAVLRALPARRGSSCLEPTHGSPRSLCACSLHSGTRSCAEK